jgi:hypothetical protein
MISDGIAGSSEPHLPRARRAGREWGRPVGVYLISSESANRASGRRKGTVGKRKFDEIKDDARVIYRKGWTFYIRFERVFGLTDILSVVL